MNIKSTLGEDTECLVEFDYQPEEPETLENPGCPESVEIWRVFAMGAEFIDLIDTNTLDRLEVECLESIDLLKATADISKTA